MVINDGRTENIKNFIDASKARNATSVNYEKGTLFFVQRLYLVEEGEVEVLSLVGAATMIIEDIIDEEEDDVLLLGLKCFILYGQFLVIMGGETFILTFEL